MTLITLLATINCMKMRKKNKKLQKRWLSGYERTYLLSLKRLKTVMMRSTLVLPYQKYLKVCRLCLELRKIKILRIKFSQKVYLQKCQSRNLFLKRSNGQSCSSNLLMRNFDKIQNLQFLKYSKNTETSLNSKWAIQLKTLRENYLC